MCSYKSLVFNSFALMILVSCGSDNDQTQSNLNLSADSINQNYSSEFKDAFVNKSLINKCGYLKSRDFNKYGSCINETNAAFNSIDWPTLDSLDDIQKNNLIGPCNYSLIRNTSKFSLCINKSLETFVSMPQNIQDDLKQSINSIKSESEAGNNENNFLDSGNKNITILSGQEVFKRSEKSVFMIYAGYGDSYKQGSAVAISKELLLTNCHVVLNANNRPYADIEFANDTVDNKRWFKAKVYKSSSSTDRCILKSLEKKDLSYLLIGRKYNELMVGERVLALGYPNASGLRKESGDRAPLSLSEGIISAIRSQDNPIKIQTDAFIVGGSSGGALLDMKGNLIGITTSGFEGTQINFAIAADEFKKL